ncbi:MAG: hypothetical protein WCE23_05760 [Candidatus Binatus sp.]
MSPLSGVRCFRLSSQLVVGEPLPGDALHHALKPLAVRPYRAWGYPLVPALYVVAASALMVDLLILKPRFTWPGLLIGLSGVPIYYWTTARARAIR